MLQCAVSYVTLQPASHSILIDANPGTMCAILAFLGRHGTCSSHVWVDLIYSPSPSRRFMVSRDVVGLILVTGVPGSTKCPVVPASDMAMSMAILIFWR